MNWFNDIIANYNEQMKDGKEISDDALFVLFEDHFIKMEHEYQYDVDVNGSEINFTDDSYRLNMCLKFVEPCFHYTFDRVHDCLLKVERKYPQGCWYLEDYVPSIEFTLTEEECDRYVRKYLKEHVKRYVENGLKNINRDYIVDTFVERCYGNEEFIDRGEIKRMLNEYV